LTFYTRVPIQGPLLAYLETILPRVATELDHWSSSAEGNRDVAQEALRTIDSRREIEQTIADAFGYPPLTLKVRLHGRDAQQTARELLTATDSPVRVTDMVLLAPNDEVVVVSPRREELRSSFAAWARARDSHRPLQAQVSDLASDRLSA